MGRCCPSPCWPSSTRGWPRRRRARPARYPGEPARPAAGAHPLRAGRPVRARRCRASTGGWSLGTASTEHGPLPFDRRTSTARVLAKLAREPVEDLRIDFEDGYGGARDAEEDAAAAAGRGRRCRAARAGVRRAAVQESWRRPTRRRAVRTLDVFLDALGPPPPGFVDHAAQGERARAGRGDGRPVWTAGERRTAWPRARCASSCRSRRRRRCSGPTATATVARLITPPTAGCTGLHYGTYDYSAVGRHRGRVPEPGPPGRRPRQGGACRSPRPAPGCGCPTARPTCCRSATPPRCGPPGTCTPRLVRRSLERGFYQGWDLHPAQLPTRYRRHLRVLPGGGAGRGRPARPLPGAARRRHPRRAGHRAGDGPVPAARPGLRRAGRGRGGVRTLRLWRVAVIDLVLRSRRVCCRTGSARPRSVRSSDGRIVGRSRRTTACRRADLGDLALLPGLVDTHVHVNEPGRTEWEGFATATRAAAAGGVTTIIDMPLNSHPADLSTSRRWRRSGPPRPGSATSTSASGAGRCRATLRPTAGAARGRRVRLQVLPDRLRGAGVPAAGPGRAGVGRCWPPSTRCSIVHAEDPARSTPRRRPSPALPRLRRVPAAGGRDRRGRRADRRGPGHRRPGAHPAPVGRRRAAAAAPRPGADGVRVTAETCPHYLTLTAEEVPDGATEFKCCPPIRDAANRDALWAGLADGTHRLRRVRPLALHAGAQAPRHRRLRARPGAGSPRCSWDCRWSGPRRAARGTTLADVVRWMAARPGRPGRAGRARAASSPGADADLVAFDPDGDVRGRPGRGCTTATRSRPYAGRTLRGVVRTTWLRGRRSTGADAARAAAGRERVMTFTALPDLASRAARRRRRWRATTSSSPRADNLVAPAPAGVGPKTFGAKGQVYDGWETRRRRDPGPRLGDRPARRARHRPRRGHRHRLVHRQLPAARLGGRAARSRATRRRPSWPRADWTPLLARVRAGRRHARTRSRSSRGAALVTHVRLTIYPDGGVARLRVHGDAGPRPPARSDAGAAGPGRAGERRPGGRLQQHVLRHAEQPADLARPGPARWARAGRPRGAATTATTGSRCGSAAPGCVRLAELDTSHFKGNAPGAARLTGCTDGRRAERPGRLVRAAAADPAAARHPAPLRAAGRAGGRPRSGWTSTPTAGWRGCGCGARRPRPAGPGWGGPGSTRCRPERRCRCSSRPGCPRPRRPRRSTPGPPSAPARCPRPSPPWSTAGAADHCRRSPLPTGRPPDPVCRGRQVGRREPRAGWEDTRMSEPQQVDLLVAGAELVATVDADRREIAGGWVAITDGAGQRASAARPTEPPAARRTLSRRRLPGHARAWSTPTTTSTRTSPGPTRRRRAAASSAGCTTLYPLWARLDEEAAYVSAWVGLAELALGGCTTSTDHLYVHPRGGGDLITAEIAAARDLGMRFHPTRGSMSAVGRRTAACRPTRWCRTTTRSSPTRERLVGRTTTGRPGAMVRIALAPCSPFSVTAGADARARPSWPSGSTCACTPTWPRTPTRTPSASTTFGRRPIEHFEDVGWGTDRSWVAHCVQPERRPRSRRLGRWGTGVAHCPSSNMILGAGLAPVARAARRRRAGRARLRRLGVRRLGLAVDGGAQRDAAGPAAARAGLDRRPGTRWRWPPAAAPACLGRDRRDRRAVRRRGAATWRCGRSTGSAYAGALSDPVEAWLRCGPTAARHTVVAGKPVVLDGAPVHPGRGGDAGPAPRGRGTIATMTAAAPSGRPGMGAIPYAGRRRLPRLGAARRARSRSPARSTTGTRHGRPAGREEAAGYWSGDVPGAKVGRRVPVRPQDAGAASSSRIDPYAREVTNSVGNGVVHDPPSTGATTSSDAAVERAGHLRAARRHVQRRARTGTPATLDERRGGSATCARSASTRSS